MMTVYETVGKNQKAVLSALHHSNEALLDMMKPLFATSEPLLKATNGLPLAEQRATPKEVVDQWFGFLEEVLKEEKTFLLNVAGFFPEAPAKTPPVKAARKAA